MIKNEIDTYISQEIKAFQAYDIVIAELEDKYKQLKINGIEDKQGYLSVRAARLDIKAKRIEVDKKRKESTENALKFQRSVNGEAKRIIASLEEIEQYLGTQEDIFESEKERIKQEKIREESELLQSRVAQLVQVGFQFNGFKYTANHGGKVIECDIQQLKAMDPLSFKSVIDGCTAYYHEEQEKLELKREFDRIRQEAEDLARKNEADRIKADREKLEAERAEFIAEKERLGIITIEPREDGVKEIKFAPAPCDIECTGIPDGIRLTLPTKNITIEKCACCEDQLPEFVNQSECESKYCTYCIPEIINEMEDFYPSEFNAVLDSIRKRKCA